jgi:hypothetical protein
MAASRLAQNPACPCTPVYSILGRVTPSFLDGSVRYPIASASLTAALDQFVRAIGRRESALALNGRTQTGRPIELAAQQIRSIEGGAKPMPAVCGRETLP